LASAALLSGGAVRRLQPEAVLLEELLAKGVEHVADIVIKPSATFRFSSGD